MVTANDPTMQAVAKLVADGDRRRAERATTAWNKVLRPYERRIVREAAVMGYILGHRDGRIDHAIGNAESSRRFPADLDIVRWVLEHCSTTTNNGSSFPYLADATTGVRRRITRKRLWPGETR
jgi:hypothetical protein